MKILCEWAPSGPSFVRSGWGKAFKFAGHDFRFWRKESKSAFDAFSEFEPDIFLGTTYELDRAIAKCIAARPQMKVALFASAWGPKIGEIDLQKYPIVVVTEQEKKTLAELKATTGRPDFVFIHVTDKFLEPTMGGWSSIGIKPVGVLNAADILEYFPAEPLKEFECDVGFVGGYWGYKGRNLNSHIVPLCAPHEGLNVKIFGRDRWPVHSYLGTIADKSVRHLIASAKVCPNVSEPHSTDLGFDIVERPFKVLSSGGFCVSDYVEEARELFAETQLLMCRTPREFHDTIRHFVEHPTDRDVYIRAGKAEVLARHTYFDRIRRFMEEFNMPTEATTIEVAKSKAIEHITSMRT